MPTTINCPSCGAPLEVNPGDRMIRCKFCSNEVAVPEAAAAAGPLMAGLPAGLDLQKIMQLKAVKELARQGKQEEAARIYQEITGSTTEDARSAIEAISAGRPVVLTSTNITQQVYDGDPAEVMDEIEKLFKDQGDPRLKAVGDLLRDASHRAQGQAIPVEAASVQMAPSSPTPASLPVEPVIVNPMDAPVSLAGGRGKWIGCAVLAVLVLMAVAGVVAFFLARSAF
jgi:LSD1 subclass zinc finger protein